ncbi:MAG: substrate-binding domain-containing protein [Rhizobiaceae bacterium]|nr:substrate-binding domain-containing protein [Rhizobiaceae bacterium]
MSKKRTRSRKGAPGIVDVASRAGVSPATVSRFFNSPDVVKGPTRKRIEDAATELGYIRDRMAGTLHNRFSGTFGLIVPTIDNAIFAEMIEAFSTTLQQQDRTMLIAAHGYDLDLEVGIVRSLLERRIDGIALVGFDHDSVALNMLSQREIPVVSIWNYAQGSGLPCVGADNQLAGYLVTEHLVALGHKDIAFVFPDTQNNDRARDRLEGAIDALKSQNIALDHQRILSCQYDLGEAKRLGEQLLALDRPTAIVCGNDVIALGMVFAANRLGLSIPEDVSIAGIGDFRGSEHLEPGLTTVRLPAKRIGKVAAETLLRMSETGLLPNPLNQALPLELKIRGSTGNP